MSLFWTLENTRLVRFLWRIADTICPDRGSLLPDVHGYYPFRRSLFDCAEEGRLSRFDLDRAKRARR